MKLIYFTIAFAMIGGLALLLNEQSTPTARLSPVRHDVPQVFALGRIEGLSEEIDIRAQLPGRIVQVAVSQGDQVTRGDVLIQLDDTRLSREVALAQADLDLTRARRQRLVNGAHPQEKREADALYNAKLHQLQLAQINWNRTYQLRTNNAVSQQLADEQHSRLKTLETEVAAAKARLDFLHAPAREDDLRIADAQIGAAQARLGIAMAQHEKMVLRAPIDGQVLSIEANSGELIGPDSPLPTIVIADTSRFRVRAFVDELDAPRVRIGMSATIVVDGTPDKTFTGRISRMSPRMTR